MTSTNMTSAGSSNGETAVVITGGGTAGHTNPGIAIAQALVTAGVPQQAVHFVGGQRGNEGELVGTAGFSIDLLPGRGLKRSLSPASMKDNVGAVRGLLTGLVQAWKILRHRRPSVVLCLGGYASFAASAVAVVQRVPLVISEQNARASAVNRLMGRFATVCALPYPDTDLPNGVLTGNPILAPVVDAINEADSSSSRTALGLPLDRIVLAVWSGSLGATSVNRTIADVARLLADRADVAIHHVVGRRDWDTYRHLGDELADAPLHYQAVEYEHRMPLLLSAADIAVTRAGASTTSELAVAGLPAVMVPLPGAPNDHQTANARELAEAGGGVVLVDSELNAESLLEILLPLLANPDARQSMAGAARAVGRPGAAAAVAALVLEAGDVSVDS